MSRHVAAPPPLSWDQRCWRLVPITAAVDAGLLLYLILS